MPRMKKFFDTKVVGEEPPRGGEEPPRGGEGRVEKRALVGCEGDGEVDGEVDGGEVETMGDTSLVGGEERNEERNGCN